MEVALVLQKKNGDFKTVPVPNKAAILGRRGDCDIRIPLQVVSRRHCQICQENSSLKVRDLRSSNGTFVNGIKIDDETIVKAGDRLQVGPLEFTVQVDGKTAFEGGGEAVAEEAGIESEIEEFEPVDDDFLDDIDLPVD